MDRRSARPPIDYKLKWYARLRELRAASEGIRRDLVVCGDFNVAPEDEDVHDPELWRGAIMCSDEERAAFDELCEIGLTDTLRIHHPEAGLFSWWDYRMLAFPKNRGLRIDAVLASQSSWQRCTAAGIDREMRKGKEPSDHAPIWAEFEYAKERNESSKKRGKAGPWFERPRKAESQIFEVFPRPRFP